MAKKIIITLGYILVFWGLLPGGLVCLAAWGEHAFEPGLHLPSRLPAGLFLAGASGLMLALSIVQFTRATGGLPISAFPPSRLIRSGVFGIWRHPIYLFSVLFFGGLIMFFWPAGSLLFAFPVLALGTLIYAKIEEGGLERRFGDAYKAHRRHTSILIPRLPHLVRPLCAVLSHFYFRLEVSGRENGALDPPFIVVSAHRSYLDPVFISLALNGPIYYVTTFEVFRNPAWRFIFTRLFCLPKKRYKPDVRNALDIRRRLLEGCAVGIFPEAERSWGGTMLGFNSEVLRLLRYCTDIPILPVRLEGTYAAWPRWARGPRRARVSVVLEKPVFTGRGQSSAELEARLSRLIEPRESPEPHSRPLAGRGIESLIYRCPVCMSFDTIRSGKGPDFRCSSCRTSFELLPDFSLRRSGRDVRESLATVSERIRIRAGDSLPAPDSQTARSKLSVEKLGRLGAVGVGFLGLSARDLTFESGGAAVRIELASVRSVVIEAAHKLQVYGGRPAGLYQFELFGQSPLKWQDLVLETVRQRFGFSPSRT